MTVRGGKNRILLYVGAVVLVALVVLLYHNSAQRLHEAEKLYERCHMNEESLSAQLQVVFEYKVRLEKSLQQEKSDHRQTKDEYQAKFDEERQQRERENSDSITKFTALQQQYKLLQSQHEDVNSECNKVREQHLTDLEDKTHLESQIKSLQQEIEKLKISKVNDVQELKTRNSQLEAEKNRLARLNEELSNKAQPGDSRFSHLERENLQLLTELDQVKSKLSYCDSKIRNKQEESQPNLEVREDTLNEPEVVKRSPQKAGTPKSSTKPSKLEKELSANAMYINTSTPMINPDAILSQENNRSNVQVRQEVGVPAADSRQGNHVQLNPFKEPQVESQREYNQEVNQVAHHNLQEESFRVLPMPGILNQFDHVPAVQNYKERLKGMSNVQNLGGEVGDENEPVLKHPIANEEIVRHPIHNKIIPRENDYHYQAEYEKDAHKEEEDDDDVDQMDYQNGNDNPEGKDKVQNRLDNPVKLKLPVENQHDSVMVNPK